MTELVKYDAACRALADARSVDEVKDVRDIAIAMKLCAKQAKRRWRSRGVEPIHFGILVELEIAVVAEFRVAARAFLRSGLALQTAFGAIRRAALGLGHRSHRSDLVGLFAPGVGKGRIAEQKTQQQDS